MADQKLTVVLTGEDAERLSRLVDDGRYESPEQAVSEALAQLDEAADPALEEWLRTVVAERYDASIADPSRGVSLTDARRRLLG